MTKAMAGDVYKPSDWMSARELFAALVNNFGSVDAADRELTDAYNNGAVASMRVPKSSWGLMRRNTEINTLEFCRSHELIVDAVGGDVKYRWDGQRAYDWAHVNKTFSAGSTHRDHVDEILRVMKEYDGVNEGAIKGLSQAKYPQAVTIFSLARDVMRDIAITNTAQWGIADGKLYHMPGRGAGEPIETTPRYALFFEIAGARKRWPQLREMASNEQKGSNQEATPARKGPPRALEPKLRAYLNRPDHRDEETDWHGAEENFSVKIPRATIRQLRKVESPRGRRRKTD